MSLFSNYSPEDVVYITSKKIAQELRNSQPQQKVPLNFKKISGIKKAAPELQKYITDIDNNETPTDDIIVGGSSAAFTQIKKYRVPKDLDISTPYLDKEVRNIAQILRTKYGSRNVVITPKITVDMGGRDIDVVIIKIKSKKGLLIDAVDIKHEKDSGFISVLQHPKLKIGRIFVEPLGYLIHRKATAIKQKYVDKIKAGSVPKARARKDIKDFQVMAKSVPDFKRKNLHLYMTEFEKSLVSFDDIPDKDEPQSQTSTDLFGGVPVIGGISDPFGTGSFFKLNKKRTGTEISQEFKLW